MQHSNVRSLSEARQHSAPFLNVNGDHEPDISVVDDRVLVVSNQPAFRDRLHDLMQAHGFECTPLCGAEANTSLIAEGAYDLVILEGALEGGRATVFCQRLAACTTAPIIVIDDGSDVIDKVVALEVGADDYLSHPLNDRELLARVRALTRRARLMVRRSSPNSGTPDAPIWTLDILTRQLIGPAGGQPVFLTPMEQNLLSVFLDHAGEPISAEEAAGCMGPGELSIHHFRTTITRLRRKLSAAGFDRSMIVNVRFGLYMLNAQIAAAGVVSARRGRLAHAGG